MNVQFRSCRDERSELRALRAHTKASYKMDFLWKTLRNAEAA
jgi:hypothetical protein